MAANDVTGDDADLLAFVQRLVAIEQTKTQCFLCANAISDGQYAREDVVPKWAQRQFNLWDEHLLLLNGTKIPYRQLKIPCCSDCNSNSLARVEAEVAQAVELGYSATKALDRQVLSLWLAKLYFGILYKEMFCKLDRSSQSNETIITPEFLRHFESLRFFLQQVKSTIQLVDFCPSSLFVFAAQRPSCPEQQWDLQDSVLTTPFIACRIGGVALFAVLADGGAQQLCEAEYDDIKDMPLHPIQFLELCAKIAYKSTLVTYIPL
jgi:hypothetical protein